MAITHITVALDVDGVIAPLVDPEDADRAARETGWSFSPIPGLGDELIAADPVVATLRALDAMSSSSAPLTMLWHTSWWLEASRNLAPALELPAMTGRLERMFATETERRTGYPWWKLTAIERWLVEHPVRANGDHELLIWVDDDIEYAVRRREISLSMQRDPRLIRISPATHKGIEPGELALLRSLTGLD